MSKLWILVNVGCIHCEVSSNIVGVFSSEERAKALADELSDSHGWRQNGQNSFEVFPMPETDVVHPDYEGTAVTA